MSARKNRSPAKKLTTAELETARLRLRRLSLRDAAAVFAYASDPQVSRYVSFVTHRSLADSRAFLRRVENRYRAGREPVWGIQLKAGGTLIGSIGFLNYSREHRRAEFGYALHRAHWGRGITTEAARAVVEFGFRKMGLNRIEARCFPENLASTRVLEKCGFQLEGVLRQREHIKGRFPDARLYSLLRQEYLGRSRRG